MGGKPFLPEHDQELIRRYPNEPTSRIASDMGRTVASCYARAYLLGVKKSKEFLSSPESGCMVKGSTLGIKTRFKKGNEPYNKGLKGLYHSTNTGCFTKGSTPKNTKYNGSISIRNNKGVKYRMIRIASGKWELYARFIWEYNNGTIPNGMIIWHKDGNSLNDKAENLELITRAENARRNHNIEKMRELYRDNPDAWFTKPRLRWIFNIPEENITEDLQRDLIVILKYKRSLRYAKANRSAKNAKNTKG